MKTTCLLPILATGMVMESAWAATISQDFEDGEDTSDWNSAWTGGAIAPAFLDPSAGVENAGGGASLTQGFSRSFRNNTAGLDVNAGYTIRMDVQVDSLSTPSLANLAFDQNVIGNGQNGNLLFYIQASAGGTEVRVDNINIASIPEPSIPLIAAAGAIGWSIRRRRARISPGRPHD